MKIRTLWTEPCWPSDDRTGGKLLKLVGFGLGLVDRTGWWGPHLGQTLRVLFPVYPF